jgi:glycosyltransferase involved in cell wall biosynthesis
MRPIASPPMIALRARRVVFVVAGEVFGGAERGALDIAEMLREEEASVAVLALDDRPGRGREVAAERGLRWVTEPVPWVGGRLHKSASLIRVTRALRALRPDAVVASTNLPNVVCGLTWRATGAKAAVWRQCDVNGTTRFGARMFRRALHATPVVVTAAEHARAWLAASYGLELSRVRVIPSVVHLEAAREPGPAWRARLDLSREALVCCMIAHLHAGKDHATLLRAWRLVVDELDGARPTLLLAGRDAATEDAVKALAFDLDLRERVRFLGEVDDVGGLLDACDLAVFCSMGELLPRGVIEPMSAGLPVVATDLPGTREALGSADPATLVPPNDPHALAGALLRYAGDRELRRRAGAANAATTRDRAADIDVRTAWTELLSDALGNR